MSKYLKVIVLIALGISSLGAEDFDLPSTSVKLKESKAKMNSHEDGYNYVDIRNQRDYDRAVKERGSDLGLSVNNSNNREMINVVKIRNVREKGKYLSGKGKYLHKIKKHDKNLGIQHRGNASHKNMTNIVTIKNSRLNGSTNSGTSIVGSGNIVGTTIINQTSTTNSSVGN